MRVDALAPISSGHRPVAVYQEKSEGKGAEFVEYFRRNTCAREMLANICRLHMFFMRKDVQDNWAQAEK